MSRRKPVSLTKRQEREVDRLVAAIKPELVENGVSERLAREFMARGIAARPLPWYVRIGRVRRRA
jgi:hypothetical protein